MAESQTCQNIFGAVRDVSPSTELLLRASAIKAAHNNSGALAAAAVVGEEICN